MQNKVKIIIISNFQEKLLPQKDSFGSENELESLTDNKDKNIEYKNQDLKKGTKDDISGAMYPPKEMGKSLDMRESNLIQKKEFPNKIDDLSGQNLNGRQSINEDVLKGLRLSGSENQKKIIPPQHLMHKNTLMGNVKISNRHLNDSEIEELRKDLLKTGGSNPKIK